MKILIQCISVLLISTAAYAQTDSILQKMSPPDINMTTDSTNHQPNSNQVKEQMRESVRDSVSTKKNTSKNEPDGVTLLHGKMMIIKAGTLSTMSKTIMMPNGTKIMIDGSYTTKGGPNRLFKEGDHMDMSGRLTPKMNNNNKIK